MTPTMTRHGGKIAGSASRLARLVGAVSSGRLGMVALVAAPTILLIGLGAAVAVVDAEREPTREQRWVGSLDPAAAGGTAPAPGVTAVGHVRDPALDAQLQQLRDEVRALRATQAGLGARVRAVELSATEPELAAAVAELEQEQARLEAQLRALAPEAAAFEAAVPAPALERTDVARLVSAALLLREAAQSATPFQDELGAFAAFVDAFADTNLDLDRPEVIDRISSLQAYAETGMATRGDLRRSFTTVARAIERAQSRTWWDSILVMIGWRDRSPAAVREAEAALLSDDLPGALNALATLTGEPAIAAEGWLTLARARLAIDDAVMALYRSALAVGGAPPDAGVASLRAAVVATELK